MAATRGNEGGKVRELREGLESRVAALDAEMAELRAEVRSTRTWRSRIRYGLLGAGVLALMATGVATGVTGDTLREGVRNPTTGNATSETQLLSAHGTGYTARLSNFNQGDGGAQASGCRSNPFNEPCLQLANLGGGRAFDIYSNATFEIGRITANGPNPAATKPFTTNAGGVATGLNADKVDGKDASELGNTRFAVVNADGSLRSGSPGVTSKKGEFCEFGFCTPITGQYEVRTGTGLSGCAAVGSVDGLGGPPGPKHVEVIESSDHIFVLVRNSDTGGVVDKAFHLMIAC